MNTREMAEEYLKKSISKNGGTCSEWASKLIGHSFFKGSAHDFPDIGRGCLRLGLELLSRKSRLSPNHSHTKYS